MLNQTEEDAAKMLAQIKVLLIGTQGQDKLLCTT